MIGRKVERKLQSFFREDKHGRMLVVRGQPTLLAGVVGDNLRTVGHKPFSPWYALRTAANR